MLGEPIPTLSCSWCFPTILRAYYVPRTGVNKQDKVLIFKDIILNM